jgi:hypothetical protein
VRALLGFSILLVVAVLLLLRHKQRPAAPRRVEPQVPRLTEAQRDEHKKKLLTLFQGALLGVQDDQDFDESLGHRRLLSAVSRFPPEEVSARVTLTLDYHSALAEPDLYRGEFVKARGVITDLRAMRLTEAVDGREDVYRGWLADPGGEEALVFDILERPDFPPESLRKDAVEIEGVFFRIVRYEGTPRPGRPEGPVKRAPWVMARNLRFLPSAHLAPSSNKQRLVLGATLALGVGLVVIYALKRRGRLAKTPRQAGFRELFEKKLREDGSQRPPG